jgi:hypothetical protein
MKNENLVELKIELELEDVRDVVRIISHSNEAILRGRGGGSCRHFFRSSHIIPS